MPDALERLTDLLALLLETRRPLTLEQIADQLETLYPAGESARRGAFERDKALLRELGVPIETEVLGGDQAGRTAYRIDRARYELRGLDLSDDERHALQLAVATIRSSDARFGLLKLGGAAEAGVPVLANVPELGCLPALRVAIAERRAVEFAYRGESRAVEPYALMLRGGFWYLIGRDRTRNAVRTFRVDRLDGDPTDGPASDFEVPEGFDAREAFPADAKEIGSSDDAPALVVVDAARSTAVVRELGDDAVSERRPDGAVVVSVPCANVDAFRSWLLGLGADAEVVGPPEVRSAVVEWLRRTVAAPAEERAGR